ncbi:hypothetical protein L1049_001432 [Liquidambar formosana]|uniref:Uncharacterized protein n=1 Tax=Liquidambar formosana TaxID=63359 RepID=A0AAP0R671_LIQFO
MALQVCCWYYPFSFWVSFITTRITAKPTRRKQEWETRAPPEGSKERKREKKKKRVHFAEDVVDPSGDSKEFRKKHGIISSNSSSTSSSSSSPRFKKKSGGGGKVTGMPANRVALYNGILRDRVVHRLAYSY